MKTLLILTIALVGSCASSKKEISHTMNQDIANYKRKARALVAENKAMASKQKLNSMSMKLIKLASPIMIGFQKKHPQCRELMGLIKKRAMAMTRLSLEQIEVQYHEGSALPKAPDVCYEAKELIVHPATVAILTSKNTLSKKHRVQIDDEIEEVLAHIDILVEN